MFARGGAPVAGALLILVGVLFALGGAASAASSHSPFDLFFRLLMGGVLMLFGVMGALNHYHHVAILLGKLATRCRKLDIPV
ncbi:MAG TPA: hypothetical protein VGL15_07060 [Vicinamibacteria bacterium]|jgi:hypothetical protein